VKRIKFKSKEKEMLYHFCKKKLKKSFYNYFIFGHRHLPLKIDLGNDSFYFNTGDWINHYSFLVFDGSTISLNYFNKKN
jgi:UDP-2,3-diacylglucosamine hydrolase